MVRGREPARPPETQRVLISRGDTVTVAAFTPIPAPALAPRPAVRGSDTVPREESPHRTVLPDIMRDRDRRYGRIADDMNE